MSTNKPEVIVKLEQAIALIHEHKQKKANTIFAVKFVKRSTGELRSMLCRFGVRKGVTGEGLKYNPDSKQLIGVYSCDKALEAAQNNDNDEKSFRMIATEGIKEVTIEGTKYVVEA